jgi:hypothetical protein
MSLFVCKGHPALSLPNRNREMDASAGQAFNDVLAGSLIRSGAFHAT